MSFSWIPIYSEIARKVMDFENRQRELLSLLARLEADGQKVISLMDKDSSGKKIPLEEIDPFTFFASFNRTHKKGGRQSILARIKEAWHLAAPVPDDFDGIPLASALSSWTFAYLMNRKPRDIPTLWRAAKEGVKTNWRNYDRSLFDEALSIRKMALARLSMGLFWLNPNGFLSFDKHTVAYFEKRGITCQKKNAAGYIAWLEKVVATAGDDFPQISLNAYAEKAALFEKAAEQKSSVKLSVLHDGERLSPSERSYWWLNVNPKIWDIRDSPIGFDQSYTSHNNKGNKRRIYKHFATVNPGDLLFCYLTNPIKEIVAVCEITKALHDTADGEAIEFKVVEKLSEPVTWAELQSVTALNTCEPFISNLGSLLALTEDEYDIIRAMIDERNLHSESRELKPFTRADALKDLFMTEIQLDVILSRLNRKKALILQGPPGVGKTFIARRLAFALMGVRDERRISMVQFHPSYGYEDFVQGYRPTRNGLERRDGVFHEFARLARNDPGNDWFFLIDEINRGNLAKIFGELLMLLESDKRGPEHAIPLTYSDKGETFDLPANLYVIGTMNTADRSLAMVDYALRRRFAFATLNPAFDSPAYAKWMKERGASDELVKRIRDRVNVVNSEIEKERDLGAGFRIGHSFFCPSDAFEPNEAWYREVVEGEIQPLLEEYFDTRERVETLVAELIAPRN